MAHGGGEVETAVPIARAVLDATSSLPEEQRRLYLILIERALSEAARKALAMEPHIQKFFTEAHRQSYDRGKSEGKAEDLVKIMTLPSASLYASGFEIVVQKKP